MKIPNAENAIIPAEKVKDYLLSSSHPVGRFKAVFFSSLGYSSSNWEIFANDIRTLLLQNDAEKTEKSEYGQKYKITGTIRGPFQKAAHLVTIWIILKDNDNPRFITAYPGDKK